MNTAELLKGFGARVGGYVSLENAPKGRIERYAFPENAAVLPFSVPYFREGESTLANFAAAPDYHAYAALINTALSEYFAQSYPGRYCRVFADVSPFHETRLAAMGGLGVIGDHGLLIDPDYSAFVVLGEAVLELDPSQLEAEGLSPAAGEVRFCDHCGACRRACPTGGIDRKETCLSAITQKKGTLTDEEEELLRKNGAVWGCDRCVLACPHTKGTQSPVEYFAKDRLGVLTEEDVSRMSDGEYARYSFSWRKREVIIRNLRICGTAEHNTDGADGDGPRR